MCTAQRVDATKGTVSEQTRGNASAKGNGTCDTQGRGSRFQKPASVLLCDNE